MKYWTPFLFVFLILPMLLAEEPAMAALAQKSTNKNHKKNSPTVDVQAAQPNADGMAQKPAQKPVKTFLRKRVWIPDFSSAAKNVSPGDLETATALAALFAGRGPYLDVITAREVRELLQLESDKTAAGCASDSCMAELADALDAQLLLTGQMGRIGPRMVVNLSLLDVDNAKVIARENIEVGNVSELSRGLKKAMQKLLIEQGGIGEQEENEVARTDWSQTLIDIIRRPDTSMLSATYGLSTLAACLPLTPWVPVMQSLAFLFLGDEIAGRKYPYWWASIPAGYAAYAIGLSTMTVGLLVANFVTVLDGDTRQSVAYGSIAAFFLSVFVLEPVISWGAGIIGAQDVEWNAQESVDEALEAQEPIAPAVTRLLGRDVVKPWNKPLFRLPTVAVAHAD